MLTLCDIRPAIMAIIELTNLSPHTVTIFLFFFIFAKTVKTHRSSKFQVHSTVLLAMVTEPRIRSLERIQPWPAAFIHQQTFRWFPRLDYCE